MYQFYLFSDTSANVSNKEPSAISHPSILLWKPASSISDHDCKKLCYIGLHTFAFYRHVLSINPLTHMYILFEIPKLCIFTYMGTL